MELQNPNVSSHLSIALHFAWVVLLYIFEAEIMWDDYKSPDSCKLDLVWFSHDLVMRICPWTWILQVGFDPLCQSSRGQQAVANSAATSGSKHPASPELTASWYSWMFISPMKQTDTFWSTNIAIEHMAHLKLIYLWKSWFSIPIFVYKMVRKVLIHPHILCFHYSIPWPIWCFWRFACLEK